MVDVEVQPKKLPIIGLANYVAKCSTRTVYNPYQACMDQGLHFPQTGIELGTFCAMD